MTAVVPGPFAGCIRSFNNSRYLVAYSDPHDAGGAPLKFRYSYLTFHKKLVFG